MIAWPHDYVARYLPVSPPVGGGPGQRTPRALVDAVRQFDVEHCARYQPGDGQTWCNIFAWDVTRALCAEIPHWITRDGRPAAPGPPAVELTVNGTIPWLEDMGHAFGWFPATMERARHAAGFGFPAVAVWANANAHGHIAVVLPSPPAPAEILIAQAGASCFSSGSLSAGFGRHTDSVRFWIHA